MLLCWRYLCGIPFIQSAKQSFYKGGLQGTEVLTACTLCVLAKAESVKILPHVSPSAFVAVKFPPKIPATASAVLEF